MSPRQPPTATPHLFVRLSKKSDMSVGDQSRSQLAGRGRSFFQLLCSRRQVTPLTSPPQLMFPEGLLKWNGGAARAEGPPRVCATNTAARLNTENDGGGPRRHRDRGLPRPPRRYLRAGPRCAVVEQRTARNTESIYGRACLRTRPW